MKDQILSHINEPEILEHLYRSNKKDFCKGIEDIEVEDVNSPLIEFWSIRLKQDHESFSFGSQKEFILITILALLSWFIAKIPDFNEINPDDFFQRNLSFVVFPTLIAYFAWRNKLNRNRQAVLSVIIILCVVFINILPEGPENSAFFLSCIHLPIFMWMILGISFLGNNHKSLFKRVDYLRFNGELIVMSVVLFIAGAILTGITFGLFSLIDVDISNLFEEYIIILELCALPLLASFLVVHNPQLVSKVAPVLARIFTPLVFITLLCYLLAVLYVGKNPYNDREFLLLFNSVLIGTIAIIFFAIAEGSKNKSTRMSNWLLFGLSLLSSVISLIALTAIIYRIIEYGISPNRLTVLGINILFIFNLILISKEILHSQKHFKNMKNVEDSIAKFMPIYALWVFLVSFIFPLFI